MNQQLTFIAMARPVMTTSALSCHGRFRHCLAAGVAAICRQCHHYSSGKPSAKRARDKLKGDMPPPAITDWATKAPTPHKTPASRTPPQAKAADVREFMKKFSIRAPAARLFAARGKKKRQAGASTHGRALLFIEWKNKRGRMRDPAEAGRSAS